MIEGLVCHTDHVECCDDDQPQGQWRQPNGSVVSEQGELFVSRGERSISLQQRSTAVPIQPGLYCCVLPTSHGPASACVVIGKCELTPWLRCICSMLNTHWLCPWPRHHCPTIWDDRPDSGSSFGWNCRTSHNSHHYHCDGQTQESFFTVSCSVSHAMPQLVLGMSLCVSTDQCRMMRVTVLQYMKLCMVLMMTWQAPPWHKWEMCSVTQRMSLTSQWNREREKPHKCSHQ